MSVIKNEYDIEYTINNMREFRLKAGLRQKDIADAMGVPRVYISRWELGIQRPGFDYLVMLYRILHGFAVK